MGARDCGDGANCSAAAQQQRSEQAARPQQGALPRPHRRWLGAGAMRHTDCQTPTAAHGIFPPPLPPRARALSAMAKPGGAPTPSAGDVVADRANVSKAVAGAALALTAAAEQLLLPAQRLRAASARPTCSRLQHLRPARPLGTRARLRRCEEQGAGSKAQAGSRQRRQHHHRPLKLRVARNVHAQVGKWPDWVVGRGGTRASGRRRTGGGRGSAPSACRP